MVKAHNEEFRHEAVRIALTSGQPRRQVAADLGDGFSTSAKRLRDVGFQTSMTGKGNCHDNAADEIFFKTLEVEQVWRQSWATSNQVSNTLFQYLNGFSSAGCEHSSIVRYLTSQVRPNISLNDNRVRD